MTLCFNELSACCSLFLLKTDGRKEMLKLKTVMSHASLLLFFFFLEPVNAQWVLQQMSVTLQKSLQLPYTFECFSVPQDFESTLYSGKT